MSNHNKNKPQHIVITGGPCVGKTTILNILLERGHSVVPESARTVIEQEQAIDGDALPWKDVAKFQDKVLELQLTNEALVIEGFAFCDRGIIDGHGYCKFFGIDTPQGIHELGRDRYRHVFILDRLPVYENDTTRVEDATMAENIHQAIIGAYVEFGHEPILVPVLAPHERVEYILERI